MKQQVKDFFGVEPYATYRDYFTVYTAIPLSQEEGVGSVNRLRDTKFETTFTGESGLKCNTDAVFDYVRRIPGMDSERLKQTLIVLTPNTTSYGGITQMWNDGSAISICPKSTQAYPYDSRGIVQHEAGGHGFGKLGDEYLYHNAFINIKSIPEEYSPSGYCCFLCGIFQMGIFLIILWSCRAQKSF